MTGVVRLYGEDVAKPDELTLARIDRERDEASQRLVKTRDIATMARLDAVWRRLPTCSAGANDGWVCGSSRTVRRRPSGPDD
jgi:hypothetical protein